MSNNEFFVELDNYRTSDFMEPTHWYHSSKILFGLFVSDSEVSPAVVSRNRFGFFRFVGDETELAEHESVGETQKTCNLCNEPITVMVGSLIEMEFTELETYPEQLYEVVQTEYLEKGRVFDLGDVSLSDLQLICDSCFNEFNSLRDSVFEDNSSIVLSFEV